MRKVQKHWRKLNTNDIYSLAGYAFDTSAYSKLLGSYKGQLEVASIRHLLTTEIDAVMRDCPNAKRKLKCVGKDVLCCLKLIGKQLQSVDVSGYRGVASDSTREWDLCPNLLDISIVSRLELREVRSIFRTPKLFLKKLDITIEDPKTLDIIVNSGICTLESVEIWCALSSVHSFSSLVEKNKFLLNADINVSRFYEFIENNRHNEAVKVVQEITCCFLKSPLLQSLSIHGDTVPFEVPNCFGPVREMIRTMYRHRRVEVTIFVEMF